MFRCLSHFQPPLTMKHDLEDALPWVAPNGELHVSNSDTPVRPASAAAAAAQQAQPAAQMQMPAAVPAYPVHQLDAMQALLQQAAQQPNGLAVNPALMGLAQAVPAMFPAMGGGVPSQEHIAQLQALPPEVQHELLLHMFAQHQAQMQQQQQQQQQLQQHQLQQQQLLQQHLQQQHQQQQPQAAQLAQLVSQMPQFQQLQQQVQLPEQYQQQAPFQPPAQVHAQQQPAHGHFLAAGQADTSADADAQQMQQLLARVLAARAPRDADTGAPLAEQAFAHPSVSPAASAPAASAPAAGSPEALAADAAAVASHMEPLVQRLESNGAVATPAAAVSVPENGNLQAMQGAAEAHMSPLLPSAAKPAEEATGAPLQAPAHLPAAPPAEQNGLAHLQSTDGKPFRDVAMHESASQPPPTPSPSLHAANVGTNGAGPGAFGNAWDCGPVNAGTALTTGGSDSIMQHS
jgi:hypothetical protein